MYMCLRVSVCLFVCVCVCVSMRESTCVYVLSCECVLVFVCLSVYVFVWCVNVIEKRHTFSKKQNEPKLESKQIDKCY